MIDFTTLNARIRDRVSPDWLTPSQRTVWDAVHRFDGPPHRVINIFGNEGTGKSFMGWLFERQGYATYSTWFEQRQPILPRLTLDDAPADRGNTRDVRPRVKQLGIQQIILLTRTRVDEQSMPAFELHVTAADLDVFRANLFRYLHLNTPEDAARNFTQILETINTLN